MSVTEDPAGVEAAARRIADQGRRELAGRLQAALRDELARAPGPIELEDDELERRVTEAITRAGGPLWRRSLAQAAGRSWGWAWPRRSVTRR